MKYAVIDLGNGRKCYSGPNCKRHGQQATEAAGEKEQFVAEAQLKANLTGESTAREAAPSYTLPTHRVAEAIAKIKRANERLSKFPEIQERYTWQLSEPRVVETGRKHYLVQDLTLNKPVLKVQGWQFAAAHEFTANGDVTTFVADPAVVNQLGGQPVSNSCDHCGSNRARERVYWLASETTGEVKQVGSTCLKGFLGISPRGLWALESDLDLPAVGGGEPGESLVYDRTQLLIGALAASNDGEDFVSRGAASHAQPATGDTVLQDWDAYAEHAFTPERFEKAHEILNWLDHVEDAQPGEYLGNLKAALNGGNWVKRKHVALAVSAIAAHANHQRRAQADAERKAAASRTKQEFYAPPGEKIKDLKLTVRKSMFFPNNFGTTNLLLMETPEGHVIKWSASNAAYRVGDTVLIKSATVKENEVYGPDEQYQTVISRPRHEKI